jgi:hypothetical protein
MTRTIVDEICRNQQLRRHMKEDIQVLKPNLPESLSSP